VTLSVSRLEQPSDAMGDIVVCYRRKDVRAKYCAKEGWRISPCGL